MGKLYNLGKILAGVGTEAAGYGLYKATEPQYHGFPCPGSILLFALGTFLIAHTAWRSYKDNSKNR